ncbi:MAG: leucine-rich repeat domain-containing protein [Bacteroidota bacterium]
MRIFCLLFLCTFVRFSAVAQDYNPEQQAILSGFENFMQAVSDQQFDQVLDRTYPGIFDVAPREFMLEAMEQTFADTTLSIRISDNNIQGISEILSLDKGDYALINYSFKMTMQFLDAETKSLDKADEYHPVRITYDILRTQYDPEGVSLNMDELMIELETINRAYAIKETDFDNWTYLEDKPEMAGVMNQLLPEAMLDHFKAEAKACQSCDDLETALVDPKQVKELSINGSMTGKPFESFPEAILEMENLEILYLSDHEMTTIPAELTQLTNLRELSFAGNQLKDLPEGLFKLPKLEELILFDNPLSEATVKQLQEAKKTHPELLILFDD